MVCYCSGKTLKCTHEAQVGAEKAALFSPGTVGKKVLLRTALTLASRTGFFWESFIGDWELFRSSQEHILSAGSVWRTVLQEGGGRPGSSSPLPSFFNPLRETRIPEMRRDGVSAERKCWHNSDFTEKYYCPLWVFAGCCHIEMCGKRSDLSIASSSCSHPFHCLLLPPRQISEEGGCEEGGGAVNWDQCIVST